MQESFKWPSLFFLTDDLQNRKIGKDDVGAYTIITPHTCPAWSEEKEWIWIFNTLHFLENLSSGQVKQSL